MDTEGEFPYPIIADPDRELAVQLGMIDPDEKTAAGLPLTARAVSIIHLVIYESCLYVLRVSFLRNYERWIHSSFLIVRWSQQSIRTL